MLITYIRVVQVEDTMCRLSYQSVGREEAKCRHEYEMIQQTTQVADESITHVLYLWAFVKCSSPTHSLNSPSLNRTTPACSLLMLKLIDSPRFSVRLSCKTGLSKNVTASHTESCWLEISCYIFLTLRQNRGHVTYFRF
jgi:hypothetical protein